MISPVRRWIGTATQRNRVPTPAWETCTTVPTFLPRLKHRLPMTTAWIWATGTFTTWTEMVTGLSARPPMSRHQQSHRQQSYHPIAVHVTLEGRRFWKPEFGFFMSAWTDLTLRACQAYQHSLARPGVRNPGQNRRALFGTNDAVRLEHYGTALGQTDRPQFFLPPALIGAIIQASKEGEVAACAEDSCLSLLDWVWA